MSYDLYDRVLGCLLAAGMGDGIGAPTEGLSQDEIAAEHGKAVETFEDGSQNFYSLGNDVAEVTDDASQMYEMAKEIVSCGGVMTPQAMAHAPEKACCVPCVGRDMATALVMAFSRSPTAVSPAAATRIDAPLDVPRP